MHLLEKQNKFGPLQSCVKVEEIVVKEEIDTEETSVNEIKKPRHKAVESDKVEKEGGAMCFKICPICNLSIGDWSIFNFHCEILFSYYVSIDTMTYNKVLGEKG